MKVILTVVLICIGINLFAQVPKAYNLQTYNGKMNGRLVRLKLADGYLGYSSISLYNKSGRLPVKFEAAEPVPDSTDHLKFVTYQPGRRDYFSLANMLNTYFQLPAFINGKYYSNGSIIPVRFYLHGHARRH